MSDRIARLAAAAFGVAALAVAGAASAQLYKCKGPDGRTVYSDRRCEASDTAGKLAPGVHNRARENEEKAAAEKAAAEKADEEARRQAEALVEAQKKLGLVPASPASPAAAPPSQGSAPAGPYVLTSRDRDRLRDLEITESSVGATPEEKTAARLEMSSIRSGREARMSAAERQVRESLRSDLSSTDAPKRRRALENLRSLYYR
jgi:hypothetical protein